MDNINDKGFLNSSYYSVKKKEFNSKESKNKIEIVNEEQLKKIEAYLEWEQEYYIIKQSYLLDRAY